MNMKQRTAIFDDSAFGSSTSVPKPDKSEIARAAATAGKAEGFKSREGQGRGVQKPQPTITKPVRRRRTGRNVQFNIKAKAETVQAFYDICDANDWVLGETLERAVELLKNEYSIKA